MMTFEQIKARFEHIVGEDADPVILAGRIDEAQIEIAKRFGKREGAWYPPARTVTASPMAEDDATITLDDGIKVEDVLVKQLCLGTGASREIVTYDTLTGDLLVNVSRGREGTEANQWPEGTEVRHLFDARMSHELPDDCIEVHEVRDVDDNPVFTYQIDEQMGLTFFANELYRLIYTPVPEMIDFENNATPSVHKVFHKDIATYCVAKHWEDMAEGIQGEEAKARAMLQQFYSRITESARHLRRNVNQQYTIGFELW